MSDDYTSESEYNDRQRHQPLSGGYTRTELENIRDNDSNSTVRDKAEKDLNDGNYQGLASRVPVSGRHMPPMIPPIPAHHSGPSIRL